MKFSQMPYTRPDSQEVKAMYGALIQQFKSAKTFQEAHDVFLEYEQKNKLVETASTLVYIRQSIDTKDAFYKEEKSFWDEFAPELEEFSQNWKEVMLNSPFRKDFEEKY